MWHGANVSKQKPKSTPILSSGWGPDPRPATNRKAIQSTWGSRNKFCFPAGLATAKRARSRGIKPGHTVRTETLPKTSQETNRWLLLLSSTQDSPFCRDHRFHPAPPVSRYQRVAQTTVISERPSHTQPSPPHLHEITYGRFERPLPSNHLYRDAPSPPARGTRSAPVPPHPAPSRLSGPPATASSTPAHWARPGAALGRAGVGGAAGGQLRRPGERLRWGRRPHSWEGWKRRAGRRSRRCPPPAGEGSSPSRVPPVRPRRRCSPPPPRCWRSTTMRTTWRCSARYGRAQPRSPRSRGGCAWQPGPSGDWGGWGVPAADGTGWDGTGGAGSRSASLAWNRSAALGRECLKRGGPGMARGSGCSTRADDAAARRDAAGRSAALRGCAVPAPLSALTARREAGRRWAAAGAGSFCLGVFCEFRTAAFQDVRRGEKLRVSFLFENGISRFFIGINCYWN